MQKAQNEILIKLFNKVYKPGDTITLRDDSGNPFQAVVKYPAVVMGGHTPTIYIEPSGSYLLSRLIMDE